MKTYIVLQPWVHDRGYQPGEQVELDEAFADGLNAFIPGMLEEAAPPDAPSATPKKKAQEPAQA